MKKLAMILAVSGLILALGNPAAGATTVLESITGSAGNWTYTYTLTNEESLPIYNWAVWFPSNPNATSVTPGSSDWNTPFSSMGYFPQQYVSEGYADYVYDSTADPFHAGTANALTGPNAEPGCYQVYANDYGTSNLGQYWDVVDSTWESLPEIEPSSGDIFEAFWRGTMYGADWGWTEGEGGNVQTSYGVAKDSTSQLIVQTSSLIPGSKSFSFNTTDYYYSINDWANSTIYTDFEGSGTVIPEPATMSLLAIGGLGVLARRRRRRSCR